MVDHKPPTTDKPTVEYSLNLKGDLIIGQEFPLTIKVTKQDPIVDFAYITIDAVSSNLTILNPEKTKFGQSIHIPLSSGNDQKTSAETTILFRVSQSTKYDEDITFTLSSNITNYQSVTYKRKAKDIDPTSLKLIVDNTYLQSPYPDSIHVATTTDATTKVHGIITDNTNKSPLSDIPIFITSTQPGQLKIFSYSNDSAGSSTIPINLFNGREGLTIKTLQNGEIDFYVHAQVSLSGKVQLLASIVGIFTQGYAHPIYAIYGGPPSDDTHSTWAPGISGYDPIGSLTSDDGETDFLVTIYPYSNPLPGDTVFFLVATGKGQPQYSGQNRTINNPKTELGIPNFYVPYQIFTYGVESQFSYVIVRTTGDSITSVSLPLTYMGGTPYSPGDSVSRTYQRCIVYTSLGISQGKVIDNDGIVNLDAIINYPGNKNDGLFIQILGTKNPSVDKDQVPIGTQVTLTSYINSSNVNGKKPYSGTIKEYSDGIYGVINIRKKDLYDVEPYDRRLGTIQLTYEFTSNGKKSYSKIWSAEIGTVPANNPNNGN
ncbi:hypothetical protein [Xenorhabdus koppenhoeferi]|uniref:Uncharacterized protein n=1 Tax=Xenorhabdus koppenhoeferi TaxID=351659 RepID=A0A1I7HGA4_9GAMM|nr:hypothetical protein [Xenorhabdus koppenhoeferi]SFU59745.1 hypothetical protein SAMN05421784_11422 [Xenorhabdus koppenhoeferi]